MNFRISDMKSNKALWLKMIVPVFIILALFIYANFFFHLPNIRQTLINNKKIEIRNLVETAYVVMEIQHEKELKGLYSREEAQERAKSYLRNMRYGDEHKDYFWVNNFDAHMIMHPYRPDMEGTDMSTYADSEGKHLVKEFVRVVKEQGAGYVDYMWQLKDNPEIDASKISYVKGFEPWGWIIGTGIYLRDIDENTNQLIEKQLKVTLFILFMAFLLVIYNVMQGREAVKRLMESENNLSITLNSIANAIIAMDAGGFITKINPVAEKIIGCKESKALGRNLEDIILFSKDGNVFSKEKIITKEKDKISIDERFCYIKSAKDKIFQVSYNIAPIKSKAGYMKGSVVVIRDITKQADLEEQLRQSQKMETVGQLAGGVAHDFNNMLAGIIGSAELLKSRIDDEDVKLQRYVEMILEAAGRAAELTRKLLDFSRKGKFLSVPVNVHGSIESTAKLLKRSIDRSINITTDFKSENCVVTGDPVQIENMLLNLCLNARDAISDKGKIRIHTNQVYLDNYFCEKSVFEISSGDFIEICVEDNGKGMSAEVVEKVFEPFFTTKEIGKGTGLGLSAVYGTVKDHNGDIHVYSEEGIGTVIKIYLPLNKTNNKNKEYKVHDYKGSGTVLIVDDEPLIREVAQKMLKDMGFSPITASNGKEAINIFESKKDEIRCVLLDIIMPDINGLSTFNMLRKKDENLKVVFASGFCFSSNVEDFIEEGKTEFIQKPFRYNELKNVFSKVLPETDD